MSKRKEPNILITGTPGTGKSTLASEVSRRTSLNFLSVNDVAAEFELYDGYDDQNECYILDDDRVIDQMEPQMYSGGQIVEYHSCDYFPERWFDAVFVLRTSNEFLYPRLKQRNYSDKKIADLIHCEIVQVLLDEARDSYNENIVHELVNNNLEDLAQNSTIITTWLTNFMINK